MHWSDPDHPRNLRLKIESLKDELEDITASFSLAVGLLESSLPYLPPGFVEHEKLDVYVKNMKEELKQWEK